MNYLVVKFIDSDDIGIISSCRIAGDGSCYWPSAPPNAVANLVKNHAIPEETTNTTWKEFRCSILSRTGKYYCTISRNNLIISCANFNGINSILYHIQH